MLSYFIRQFKKLPEAIDNRLKSRNKSAKSRSTTPGQMMIKGCDEKNTIHHDLSKKLTSNIQIVNKHMRVWISCPDIPEVVEEASCA